VIRATSAEAFAAAVDDYVFVDVNVDVEAAALDGADIALVGEAHGLRETPSVLYALGRALGTRELGLEWSHDEVGEYAPDFEIEALWRLPPDAELFAADGRYTAGHFALIRRLREEGLLDRLILFDRLDPEPPDDWRPRDAEMASRLLAEWKRTPLLAAAGAFHVEVETTGTMAWHLAQRRLDLRTARLPHQGSPATVPARA
jgi:hypothetical protein